MTAYVLDTNAYALLFQAPRSQAYINLERILLKDGVMSFYLPEIVSMEIHSVLGKFRRTGGKELRELCSRKVVGEVDIIACTHTCYTPAKPKMKQKVYKGLIKLVRDIESQSGNIKANIMPFSSQEMGAGKRILSQYAHKYSFGSHDALVAGTVLAANSAQENYVLVTSDKALKAVCRDENIPCIDPNNLIQI